MRTARHPGPTVPGAGPSGSLLIATSPRSGSWLLAEGLRQLDLVGRPEEFFWREIEPLYRARWGHPPTGDDAAYLAAILAAGTSPTGMFAAKVHWFQFAQLGRRLHTIDGTTSDDHPDVATLERHLGPVRFVYLYRRDVVRQAISWVRALRTDVWWDVPGVRDDRPTALGSFDFEAVKNLEYLLRDYDAAWRAWFAASGVVPLEVAYEDLSRDFATTLRVIVRHAGLEPPGTIPEAPLAKQSDRANDAWRGHYDAARVRLAL